MSQEGRVLHGYAYDAGNRLERAWNEEGEKAVYLYNGVGQRVERRSGSNIAFQMTIAGGGGIPGISM